MEEYISLVLRNEEFRIIETIDYSVDDINITLITKNWDDVILPKIQFVMAEYLERNN